MTTNLNSTATVVRCLRANDGDWALAVGDDTKEEEETEPEGGGRRLACEGEGDNFVFFFLLEKRAPLTLKN